MSASRHTYAVCIKKDQLEIKDTQCDCEFLPALVVTWKYDDQTGMFVPAVYGSRSDAREQCDRMNDQYPDSYEVIQLR